MKGKGKSYILTLMLVLSFLLTASAETPWDIILLDVSEDFMPDIEETHEVKPYADDIMQVLKKSVSPEKKLMLFAKGRAYLSFGDYETGVKNKLELFSNALEGSTSIYDAAGSVLNLSKKPKRILIISNGINTGGSFSPSTMGDIMRSEGVKVDAILYPRQLEPKLDMGEKAELFLRRSPDSFEKFVKKTGGKICLVEVEKQIPYNKLEQKIKSFMDEVTVDAANHKDTGYKSGLDKGIVEQTVSRLKPEKLNIVEVDTAVKLHYMDMVYEGLEDIKRKAKVRNGVVGEDYRSYPCFDSSDAIYENRYYANYVFGESPAETAQKLRLLKEIKEKNNYCKLNDQTPLLLLPMVYYSGSGTKMLVCGFDIEYTDEEYDDSDEDDGEDI